jgi:hypothetical protein
MRERHETAERKKEGRPSAAASSDEVHGGGEHDRQLRGRRVRRPTQDLDAPPGNPPLPAREYPAILREYASSGFRDDPREPRR